MTAAFERLDVLMSGSPLFWLTLTLIVFQASSYLFRRSGFFPLLNPVLVSVVLLVTVLKLSGVEYHRYMEGGRFLHFLLGPATVALAVPLYRQIGLLRKTLGATTIALLAGSLMAVASSVAIARLGGAPWQLLLSLAPKSVTTPIAMGISERIGGQPSLTAAMVVLTGITGASFGPLVLSLCRVRNKAARGLALGVASHGIGTARAMQEDPQSGAIAGLAMGLNGLLTALYLPLLALLLR